MGKGIFETLMGAVVLFVAIGFVTIAYQSGTVDTGSGYKVKAKFDRVDGLGIGSDIRVSGIKKGTVNSLDIDPKTYLAIITMSIDKSVKLPKDSSAEIVSDGLLGGKYVAIVPGGDEQMLDDGDEIHYTQSAVNIEQLLGKFAFGSADSGEKKSDEVSTKSGSPAGNTKTDEDNIF